MMTGVYYNHTNNLSKTMTQQNQKQLTVFRSETDLKNLLATQYMKQIVNFFSDEKQAMKFLSSVMADVQKTPALIQCEPTSLINSYMTMAQLGLMPSGVSGEAYVLPYVKSVQVAPNKWEKITQAQFQLGYQGLVTLFYRAGGQKIHADIVREKDEFSYENGAIKHKIDIFKSNEKRGAAVGAYVIATFNGEEIVKAMNKDDIVAMGKQFSKSFESKHTPWDEKNDPELWMWKKTVLKQLGKMLPKNETIYRAIAADNEDSIIADRINAAKDEAKSLTMGNLLKPHDKKENNKGEENQDGATDAEGPQGEAPSGEPTININ